MSGERILLTGGSGFLGSRLALMAAARGHRVWATHLNNPVPEADGVTPVRLDLAGRAAGMESLLAEVSPTLVLHLAYSMTDAALNIEATSRLTSTCAAMKQQPFFLYTSTDLVFDGRRGNYAEDDEPRPVLEYGRQKLEAERVVRAALPGAAVVRPSLIYDLSRLPRHLSFAVRATERGEEFTFFTDEYRCPVLADELAGAVLELAVRRLEGTWHAAGADRVDRWWFGTRLLAALRKPVSLARRGLSADLPGERPSDCSFDSGKLYQLLGSPLSGARQVLGLIEVEE